MVSTVAYFGQIFLGMLGDPPLRRALQAGDPCAPPRIAEDGDILQLLSLSRERWLFSVDG